MCCRKCLVTAFVSAHVGVCSIVGSDMCLQVVSSGETLATSFMGALLNRKVHQSSNLQHIYILHIKSRLLKDNQLSWLLRLQEACSRLQDSNVRFYSSNNCVGVGERDSHYPIPQITHIIFLLGLLYFCNIPTVWEPGTGQALPRLNPSLLFLGSHLSVHNNKQRSSIYYSLQLPLVLENWTWQVC